MTADHVVIQSPMSFVGSARRIWRLTRTGPTWTRALTIPTAVLLIAAAWCGVLAWTLVFGVLLIPYRLMRRGQRKRKQEAARHNELLNAARSVPSP